MCDLVFSFNDLLPWLTLLLYRRSGTCTTWRMFMRYRISYSTLHCTSHPSGLSCMVVTLQAVTVTPGPTIAGKLLPRPLPSTTTDDPYAADRPLLAVVPPNSVCHIIFPLLPRRFSHVVPSPSSLFPPPPMSPVPIVINTPAYGPSQRLSGQVYVYSLRTQARVTELQFTEPVCNVLAR